MDLLKSKKFKVLVSGTVLLIVQSLVPELVDLNTAELMALLVAYLVGQGVADHGKEAAKVEARIS